MGLKCKCSCLKIITKLMFILLVHGTTSLVFFMAIFNSCFLKFYMW
jgi:hypothetical protein